MADNLRVIDDFTSPLEVLLYSSKVALHYGYICAALEIQGQIIGVNDLQILL